MTMDRNRVLLVVAGLVLVASGLGLFFGSHQYSRSAQCLLPLAAAADQVAIGGCDALLAVDAAGQITWSRTYADLGLAGAPYSLDIDATGSRLLIADVAAPAVVRCDWPLNQCEPDTLAVATASTPFLVASAADAEWLVTPDDHSVRPLTEARGLPPGLRLRSPQGVARQGPDLWIADTGNRRLLRVRKNTAGSPVATEIRIGDSTGGRPLTVLPANGILWLILDDEPLAPRRVVVVNHDGRLLREFRLPGDAVPTAMAPLDDRAVLISDSARLRLFLAVADGGVVEAFPDTPISTHLDADRRRMDARRNGQRLGYGLFALGLLLLGHGLRPRKDAIEPPRRGTSHRTLAAVPRGVPWLRPQRQRLAMVLLGALMLMWVGMLTLMALILGPGMLDLVLAERFRGDWPLYTVPIVIAIAMRAIALRDSHLQLLRIAGHQGEVLVQRGGGPVVAYDPSHLEYSDDAILLNRHLLRLNSAGVGGFRIDELARDIFPLLARGRYLTPGQLRQRAIAQGAVGDRRLLVLVLIAIGAGLLVDHYIIL